MEIQMLSSRYFPPFTFTECVDVSSGTDYFHIWASSTPTSWPQERSYFATGNLKLDRKAAAILAGALKLFLDTEKDIQDND